MPGPNCYRDNDEAGDIVCTGSTSGHVSQFLVNW